MTAAERLGHDPFGSDQEVAQLLTAFWDGSLSRTSFTHRAHLTVGLWYLDHHSASEARRLVPEEIKRFNALVGTTEKPRGGYHETITQFYLSMIEIFRREWRGEPSVAARANALFERLADRTLPQQYYSDDLLWSPEARSTWVEPDLRPVPI